MKKNKLFFYLTYLLRIVHNILCNLKGGIMKKFKKFAVMFSLALVVALGGVGLAACGEKDPTIDVANNVVAEAANVIEVMRTDVVNKLTKVDEGSEASAQGTYTVAQVMEEVPTFSKYYVALGTLHNVDDLQSLSFGDATFDKDEEIYLSVGLNKFIKDKVFYVEDGTLYMAAPMFLVESAGKTTIKLNDKSAKFETTPAVETFEYTDVRFTSETTNTVEENPDGSYTLSYRETGAKSRVGFYFEDMPTDETFSINRLYKNGELNSYALAINSVADKDGLYPVTYYTIPYTTESIDTIDAEKWENSTMTITSYVEDKGVATVTIVNHLVQTVEEVA